MGFLLFILFLIMGITVNHWFFAGCIVLILLWASETGRRY